MPSTLVASSPTAAAVSTRPPRARRGLFVLWLLVVVATTGAAGWKTYTHLTEQSLERARERRDLQLQGLASDLESEDSPYTDSVRASVHLLRDNTLALGVPNLGPGKIPVGKEIVPDLRFGSHSVANDFTLVDEVVRVMGGTATLFVKSGERFIRVTTNIKTPAGARAIGTELDPNGRAMVAIREDKTFTGAVDILGKSYFTIYEPIHAAGGETIGIWYVGYPVLTAK